MADCGGIEFLRGGVIAETHITASSVSDSRVSSSELDSCHLKNTASVDAASAQVIANALAALPQGVLTALAAAIASALPKAPLANGPQVSTEETLPTGIAGGREALLGKPDAWLGYQDFVVPAYKEGA